MTTLSRRICVVCRVVTVDAKLVNGRKYCHSCLASFRAYSRSKPCVDETRGIGVSLRPEGVAAVRTWAL
jgi:hypothetical protein